ncbi:hypothetical protein MKQ70_37150 [Chitinophaga sedimenti]|uniref:hypothetical protein n=1 Tax=Chitinophaga sedimenti TaxID=2033606 RepID=UPI0020040815|nr:hypothetical protein [Chitinophaga sedimenti]MCK7560238.1 hypothetical protein [Chitinophaga sedimenti]
MIKKLHLILLMIACLPAGLYAQVSGSFNVQGDYSKFYPVTFYDGGFWSHFPTELNLGRSYVHADGDWHGSMIANIRFHVTAWGHGSRFIDVNQHQFNPNNQNGVFIAAWDDISGDNPTERIVVWLRGATTYNYRANVNVLPVVYDGVQNALPLTVPNSVIAPITFKTAPEIYVNANGITNESTAYFRGEGLNFINGSLGIGTFKTNGHKLAVEGTIGARKIKVDQQTWADYVFADDYKLPSIPEIERFIREHKHLPEIPSAEEVAENGLDVGEMNKKLLQKVEELTLYLIEQNKRMDAMEGELKDLRERR